MPWKSPNLGPKVGVEGILGRKAGHANDQLVEVGTIGRGDTMIDRGGHENVTVLEAETVIEEPTINVGPEVADVQEQGLGLEIVKIGTENAKKVRKISGNWLTIEIFLYACYLL